MPAATGVRLGALARGELAELAPRGGVPGGSLSVQVSRPVPNPSTRIQQSQDTLTTVSGRVLPAGKIPAELLGELLAQGPTLPSEVLLGPEPGEDACAVQIGDGILVVAADPITLTGSGVGAHAVQVNANDVAVTGVRPRWFLATALLPVGTTDEQVRELFAETRVALHRAGVSLVGGHTEVTAAVRQPVVSGVMLGYRPDGRFVRTGGVRPGDVLVQVGAAPVEGACVLATECPERLVDLDPALCAAALGALERPGISVVAQALRAAELGATALHDPTEGGLASGLIELADASGVSLEVRAADVAWFEPGVAICRALGADPLGSLASGTLLAAFPADRVQAAAAELDAPGRPARVIGVAVDGRGVSLDGTSLALPARDEVARVLEAH